MRCEKHNCPGIEHITCPECIKEDQATEQAMSDPNTVWCGQDAGSSAEMCGDCQFREKAKIQVSPGVFKETERWTCTAFDYVVRLEYAPKPKLWRCNRTKFPGGRG